MVQDFWRLCDPVFRKFLFKSVGVLVVLANGVADCSHLVRQALVLVSDSLVPSHGQISLDVCLGHCCILFQLQESSTLLASQDVGLSSH